MSYINNDITTVKSSVSAISTDGRDGERVFAFDLIRFVAITMVIVSHIAPIYLTEEVGVLMSCLVCGDAVLFFMVSGALLCPIKGDYKKFVLKHVKRVAIPFLLWSVLYMALEYFLNEASWSVLKRQILEFPVVSPFLPGWFVYVMIGIYLFAPIISVWIENVHRRWVEYFLLFWIISSFAPYAVLFANFNVSETFAGQFAGYLGYWILGYYLYRYPLSDRSRRFKIVAWSLLLFFAVAYTIRWYFFTVKYDLTYVLSDDMSINTVAYSIIVFVLLLKVKNGRGIVRRFVSHVAKLSFGMYLCHDAIIRYVVVPHMGDVPCMATTASILVLLLSFLVAELLYRLPFRRYLL